MRKNTKKRKMRKNTKRKYKILTKTNKTIDISNYLFCNVDIYIDNTTMFNIIDENILSDNCTPFVDDFTSNCIMPYNIKKDANDIFYLDNMPLKYTNLGRIGSASSYGDVYLINLTNPSTSNSSKFILKISKDMINPSEEWKLRKKLSIIKKCTCFIPLLPLSPRHTLMPVADGSLFDLATKRIFLKDYNQVLSLYVTLLDIFNCVTTNGLVYIDIKPENILFKVINNKQIQLLVADIGSFLEDPNTCYTATPDYFPPSIVNTPTRYDWICKSRSNKKQFNSRIILIQLYAITKTIYTLLEIQYSVIQIDSLNNIVVNLQNFYEEIDRQCVYIMDLVNINVLYDFILQMSTNNSNISFIDIFANSLSKFGN